MNSDSQKWNIAQTPQFLECDFNVSSIPFTSLNGISDEKSFSAQPMSNLWQRSPLSCHCSIPASRWGEHTTLIVPEGESFEWRWSAGQQTFNSSDEPFFITITSKMTVEEIHV